MLEIYAWAGVFTAMSVVRPHECREPAEWAAALIAGALWPLVVAVRLTRWVQRNRRAA
jgi:hypothetical protein